MDREGFAELGAVRLYYRTIGEGDPIVFLHGGPGLFHDYFLPHVEGLASDYQLIFFDQRGGGRSLQPLDPDQLTIADFVEDIERLRRFLELGPVHLLGHSWGGLLAMLYAIIHADGLRSLLLVDSAAPTPALMMKTMLNRQRSMAESPELGRLAQSKALQEGDPVTVSRYFELMDVGSLHDQSLFPQINVKFTRPTAKAMLEVSALLFPQMAAVDLSKDLGTVSTPALIVHGRDDFIPVESAELTHQLIHDSELAIFEACGHYPFLERKADFLAAVRVFLGSL